MTISANFPATRPSLLLDFSNQTVLDPRVTFTRTTTAYYYDNHSAALGEQNLLNYSNTFNNAYWSTTGISVAQNATDPAGATNGAWTNTTSTGTTYHILALAATSISFGVATYTVSAFLQAGTNSFMSLIVNAGSTNSVTATFNLPTGLSQTPVSYGAFSYVASSATVTQVGSTNWYRCSFAFTSSSTINGGITIQQNNTATPTIPSSGFGLQAAWIAAGTETILIYGAQVEQRATPTVYTATTATAVNTYTPTLQVAPINSPRFDYNPVTRESLGLFLEQAATNVMTYSADFTNAAWTKSNFPITASVSISPDGTQNASLAVVNPVFIGHSINQTFTYTAATYTQSVYLKYYGYQFVQLVTNANGGVTYCNFDLINGTKGTPSGGGSPVVDIQPAGNGWYRCSLTLTAIASNAGFYITASNSITASNAPAFSGNGFNGYLIWGAQVELAPSATSYIATTTAAQTRTIDAASMTGTNFSSWYNYNGGTVYVEAASGSQPNIGPYSVFISDATNNNQIGISYTSTSVTTYARANGVTLQTLSVALPSATLTNTFYKTAWYFSGSGNGVSSVGQTATTYATAINVPAVNQMNFAYNGSNSANPLNGRIKKFAYYPVVLTNTQIQSLSAN